MNADAAVNLMPYAVHDDASAGRLHPEPEDPGRSPFARDRQRVLQSTAFRRLEYKTQVFVSHEHDHFRTRLTHTLEVAEIARRLAVMLRLNEPLAETIALAHDLGHPPFGHAGEAALNKLMANHGGFEHNAQSLRIVDYLEHPFPPFRGLNLSFEVREGLAKHVTAYDHPAQGKDDGPAVADPIATGPSPSLEGQIASLADRLAYDCHDLEDALGAGLIDETNLAEVEVWAEAAAPIREQYPDLSLHAVRRPILNALTDMLLDDAAGETRRRIEATAIATVDDVRRSPAALVSLPETVHLKLAEFESFLRDRVYHHERLVQMDRQAGRTITAVFNAFAGNPDALPPRFTARIPEAGLHQVVCDYVAGMTDRFCQAEHDRLCT